jgi:TonB-linked SusC/RagA family outer membrane protein
MRITISHLGVILLLTGFAYAGEGYSQDLLNSTISLRLNNVTLREALQTFEQRTALTFSYSQDFVQLDQKVSVNAKNDRLSRVLEKMFKPLQIHYELLGNQVLLKKVPARKPETNTSALPEATDHPTAAAALTITGKVTAGDNKEGIPGVNVVLKGTSNGTITGTDGSYSLSVPDESANGTLVFSFIGYVTEEVAIGNRSAIDVALVADIKALNEVVVVGYGTQRKRDVTGAVASVSAADIRQVPVLTPDQALQGRVSGVQVQQTSGAPGGAVQVRIRGVNSTGKEGANQPLYVVDGVPLSWNEINNSLGAGNEGSSGGVASNGSSPLAGINPNDIESIEVLKDASSTAIYGARAANGVVLITTRSGKAGRTQINFDAYYGVQTLRKKIPLINARERMAMNFEWRRNAGTRGGDNRDIFAVNPYLYNYDGNGGQDELFRQAPMQNYSLSASGGSDKITFATSAEIMDQQGIVLSTYAKRFSGRANLDIKASDRLRFSTRTSVSYTTDNRVETDEFFRGLSYNVAPGSPLRDADGNFTGRPNNLIAGDLVHDGNGNAAANLLERERRSNRYRLLSNLYAELDIAKGLTFKSMFGTDLLFNDLRRRDPLFIRGIDVNNNQTVDVSQPRAFNWLAEQLLFYKRTFGVHSVDVTAGFSAQQFIEHTLSVRSTGSPSNALDQLGNQPGYVGTPSGGRTDNALVSQFLRLNYGLLDRYLLTATVRRDGSSRFGSNYKYGYFPSASLGWRISEEPFIKNIVQIPELKLRVSYGSTGNQNIDNFLYLPLMNDGNAVWGNTIVNGASPNRFANPDIRWERNNQFDAGIDLSLLRGRLTVTADYYHKRTDGLLGQAPISVISGVGRTFTTNLGIISNRGFEFATNAVIIDRNSLRWSANFNIATNQNKVEKLGEPFINGADIARIGSFINRTQEGRPIGAFWVIEEEGQYQDWEEALTAPRIAIGGTQPYFAPGDFKPVDQNGDGVIDDQDRVWVGSPFPDFFGGFGTTLSFKGLSLDVVGSYQYGNLLWNQPRLVSETFEGTSWRVHYDNRWLPSQPGVVTSVPVPRNNNPLLVSGRFLEDASFLRIRTVTLGYELPAGLISKAKLSRARLYVQANNFFTFTKYSGWDPEVNSFGSNVTTNGVDIGAYPIPKTVTVGINLGL